MASSIHTELRAVLPLIELDGQMTAVVAVSDDDPRRALSNYDRAAIPSGEQKRQPRERSLRWLSFTDLLLMVMRMLSYLTAKNYCMS